MPIGRTDIPQKPTSYASRELADSHGVLGAWLSPTRVVARSMVMVALAAFAILVLLPAAVAAQAAVSI